MPSLESSIDNLYKGPLDEFVAARTALAKTLTGTDASRVKRLPKPMGVPWAVNQVYWHAPAVYGRVTKSGEKLRAAQIAGLKGRSADVRGATDEHRKAIADAVAEASRLASAAGEHPDVEKLVRTFEALSLAPDLPEPPGRLSKPLQPAGFEALAGVALKPAARAPVAHHPAAGPGVPPTARVARSRFIDEARKRDRQAAAAQRQKSVAITKAEGAVVRAKAVEAHARDEWERRKRDLAQAERTLAELRAR